MITALKNVSLLCTTKCIGVNYLVCYGEFIFVSLRALLSATVSRLMLFQKIEGQN